MVYQNVFRNQASDFDALSSFLSILRRGEDDKGIQKTGDDKFKFFDIVVKYIIQIKNPGTKV
jgi:hypothetical protein